jgi:hypothetical protein
MVACRAKSIAFKLMLLGFGFLNTDYVSILLREPFKETFSLRRTDTIGIAGDDAHKRYSFYS